MPADNVFVVAASENPNPTIGISINGAPEEVTHGAMALATAYNIPITWPALSPLGDDAYLSNLTKLVQTFPPKEASIDWVQKWVDACLDFRKCVTSSSVSWMGHDLHSMTFKQLYAYLVECGLGPCKAQDVARDIFYAREVRKQWLRQTKSIIPEEDHSSRLLGYVHRNPLLFVALFLVFVLVICFICAYQSTGMLFVALLAFVFSAIWLSQEYDSTGIWIRRPWRLAIST